MVVMSSERHYMFVNPTGDICFVYRGTGKLSDAPFPIMMRDEWGEILPYAEKGRHNHGCVPLDVNSSNEIFTRIMIDEEQFALIGHPMFFCYHYDKQGRKIALRPGHKKVKRDMGMWQNPEKESYRVEVAYPDDLERCGIAYGGRPIYWIKWTSDKSHEDFPELVKQGCLHPLKYKPREVQQERRTTFPMYKTLPFTRDENSPFKTILY